jgi:lipoate-protein ligase A
MEWRVIPADPLPAATNLALDEVLTAAVGRGERGATLRFWGWTDPCVVLGRFQSVRNEIHLERAAELGFQIVRRVTGGGAMLIEPESAITYSLHTGPGFVEGLSFAESYALFDSWVVQALRELGIDAWYQPLNDITSANGKIAGAAQARRSGAVLHHTTMAYDMTPGILTQIIRIGLEKVSDKGIRSANKRVGPLRLQTNLPRQEVIDHLTRRFTALTGATPGLVTSAELAQAERLAQEKFATPEWTFLLP